MRSEQEMMELILGLAEKEERVRVVGLEGSRANANVSPDAFQDYDITYVVTDMEFFKKDDAWLAHFGRRIILQKPEAMAMFAPELGGWFTYLMLFEDGNRIDLKLVPLEDIAAYVESNRLMKILMDKDRRLKPLPAATDQAYRVQRPSAVFFEDCCNEFWWVSTYVAKGLCRREILYASEHLNDCVRPMLLRMLAWEIGIETAFSVSVGKSYKYMERYVDSVIWKRLLGTYRAASYETLWQALFENQALFRETAQRVADHLGYVYPDYAEKVAAYTKRLYERRTLEVETTDGAQVAACASGAAVAIETVDDRRALETAARLALALWPQHTLAKLEEELGEYVADGKAVLFVATERQQPVGFAQCQLRTDYVEGTCGGPVGYLEGIFVEATHRGKGIAKQLVNHCEAWSKSRGCEEFASDCELSNADSFRFHMRMGFREANRIICFTKTL